MDTPLAPILAAVDAALAAGRPAEARALAAGGLPAHPASGLLRLRLAAACRALGDGPAADEAERAAYALSPALAPVSISVVAPPAADPAARRRLLDALAGYAAPPFELLLADDAAGETAAAGQNPAAARARGDWLLLLADADAPPPDRAAAIAAEAEAAGAALAGPWPVRVAGPGVAEAVTGPWLLVKRADFALAGGLDEGFRAELRGADLCWRLRQMGRRSIRVPDAAPAPGGFDAADAERLRTKWTAWMAAGGFEPASRPPVSVVVPAFNKVEFTRTCLAAFEANTPAGWPELLIVDNASTDGTAAFLAGLGPRATVVRNAENRGFGPACNQMAALATGKYVVFLNNDTLPFPGWLEALVAEAEADPAVGVVGCKLLYPQNDAIQHAGIGLGVSGGRRVPIHALRYAHVGHPRANVPRDLDVVTGACLLVRRDVFVALGGFDEGYVNGFEDVDLCLRAREAGWKVRYTPLAVLYHHESISDGRQDHEDANFRRYAATWDGRFDARGRLDLSRGARSAPP